MFAGPGAYTPQQPQASHKKHRVPEIVNPTAATAIAALQAKLRSSRHAAYIEASAVEAVVKATLKHGTVEVSETWLCCAVLCRAAPCCAVLCCAAPCCAVLCCAVLCCVVLCCDTLHCAVLCCVVLRCAVMCCAVPRCAALCFTVQRYAVLGPAVFC